MLQTLERNVQTFDARVLSAAGTAALAELTGPAGLPFLPPDRQRAALEPACGRQATGPTARARC